MKELITPQEAARRLRISRMTIYRRIHDGTIGGVRLGPRLLYIDWQELCAQLRNGSMYERRGA
jgi:excisionase family DNA binding protein